nr:transcription factor DIVARICATA-like [Ipomoea trifida]
MEILSPAASSYLSNSYSNSNSNWLFEESMSFTKWTPAENKAFENALALYDKDTPDRWKKVAEMVPGKTVTDVMRQYKELEDDISSIEAGLMDLIPFPANTTRSASASAFTLEWGCSHPFDAQKQCFVAGGKRPPSNRLPEQERKKGIPWTEEEHKLFLMGLKKYGKGDWRNISRNFVITRTPTQVASHAQKFFIRQHSGGKDKRRASIHDITTVNLNENQTPSPDNKIPPGSTDQPVVVSRQQNSALHHKMPFHWDHLGLNSAQANLFMSPPYGIDSSYGMNKLQSLGMQRAAAMHHESSYFGSQIMPFQIQSAAPQYYRA